MSGKLKNMREGEERYLAQHNRLREKRGRKNEFAAASHETVADRRPHQMGCHGEHDRNDAGRH